MLLQGFQIGAKRNYIVLYRIRHSVEIVFCSKFQKPTQQVMIKGSTQRNWKALRDVLPEQIKDGVKLQRLANHFTECNFSPSVTWLHCLGLPSNHIYRVRWHSEYCFRNQVTLSGFSLQTSFTSCDGIQNSVPVSRLLCLRFPHKPRLPSVVAFGFQFL